jgi:hypothetical protein
MVASLIELHSALICASAPAIKGSVVIALNWVLRKFGRKEKDFSFSDDEFVTYPKGDLEKKGVVSVKVTTVHRYES